MKKYKVAFIHNIISPYRVPLFEGLSSHLSIDLYVFFCAKTHKHRKWDILESKGYNYEILPGKTIEYSYITYHINPSIVSRLIKGKYDVVILGGNPDFTVHMSFLVCKFLKIPVIWWSEAIESSQTKLGKLISPLTKYIVKNVDAVVVPSTISRDFHIKLGADSNNIFFAHNIVDNELFLRKSMQFKDKKEEIKKELGIEDKKIILYVGRLVEGKGIQYLLEAYDKLKKENETLCLILIGDGDYRDKLSYICNNKQIKDVIFLGWLSEERIKYYGISDIFVLPTLRDLCPLVINEAMACSLPVIATQAAGNSKDMIFSGENGYIVRPKDIDQLYYSIKKVMQDEELRDKMSRRSLEIIQNSYSIEKTVNGFVCAIKHAVSNKNSISHSEC